MQVHPVEVWDLLDLLAMPTGVDGSPRFVEFFEDIGAASGSVDRPRWNGWQRLFRVAEEVYGTSVRWQFRVRNGLRSCLPTQGRNRLLRALRDDGERSAASVGETQEKSCCPDSIMRSHTPDQASGFPPHPRPASSLFRRRACWTTPIAARDVDDRFVDDVDRRTCGLRRSSRSTYRSDLQPGGRRMRPQRRRLHHDQSIGDVSRALASQALGDDVAANGIWRLSRVGVEMLAVLGRRPAGRRSGLTRRTAMRRRLQLPFTRSALLAEETRETSRRYLLDCHRPPAALTPS